MKNIIAIACGYIAGCGLGENAKAAIITRGLSEIIDLGIKMGAKRNTLWFIWYWRPNSLMFLFKIKEC